jgi:hypothetical protein
MPKSRSAAILSRPAGAVVGHPDEESGKTPTLDGKALTSEGSGVLTVANVRHTLTSSPLRNGP